ncbi:hypothetical protein SCOR_28645 [Sulfidibacter corallicola]|uniref:Outer membrane lipoprotein-sorting protein n=1 Tax=Sulfidibacter corallicola TaxID=2818388 RepID=A0A8A4TMN9_SULCO|nr:DUF3108 domain-containing protein [Sulfidibacter corallicola]QTD50474.1 hypothetical protein J3U87_33235 [Sulfidibacter corallicola]
MTLDAFVGLWFAILAAIAAGDEPAVIAPGDLDLQRMVMGNAHFVQFFKGERSGTMDLSIVKKDGKVVVRDLTRVPKFRIEEELVVTLDHRSLAIDTIRAGGHFGEKKVDVELARIDGNLTGTIQLGAASDTKHLDDALAANVFSRVGLFAMLPAFDFKDGASYALTMFDSLGGKTYDVQIAVSRVTNKDIARGIPLWRVEVNGHVARQAFFITQTVPRRTVRIEVLDSPWTYELVEGIGASDR